MTVDEKLNYILENMATKDDLKGTAKKEDLTGMATKNDLDYLESSLLSEIDLVQEKANTHFTKIEKRLGILESTVNTIKIESSTVSLLLKKVTIMEDELKTVKKHLNVS